MSFLDDIFGVSAARDDARDSYRSSTQMLDGGLNRALGELGRGTGGAIGTLRNSGQRAIGDFRSGRARARGDIRGGYRDAVDATRGGTNRALEALDNSMTRTEGVLNPIIERGQQAGDLYGTYLGLDGADAQTQALDTYQTSDPFREFNEDLTRTAYERNANARGGAYDPRTETAIARANLERGAQDYNSYLDRLFGVSSTGNAASGQLAGYIQNTGTNQASLQAGEGQQLAGLATGRGGALANVATNAAGNIAGTRMNTGNNIAGIQQGQGAERANLIYGNAQQNAGNRINMGNALAETRGVGLNRALSLGGTLLAAANPGASGVSALGNIAGGFR